MRCPIHGSLLVKGECQRCKDKAAYRKLVNELATKAGAKPSK